MSLLACVFQVYHTIPPREIWGVTMELQPIRPVTVPAINMDIQIQ